MDYYSGRSFINVFNSVAIDSGRFAVITREDLGADKVKIDRRALV